MPQDGPGPTTVRNEAFRLLAEALDLPGGIDQLQQINLDHAVPIVTLNGMMRRELGNFIAFSDEFTTAGTSSWTNGAAGLSFWSEFQSSAWNNVVANPAGRTGYPLGWDVVLLGVSATTDTTGQANAMQFLTGASGSGQPLIARYNRESNGLLDSVNTALTQLPYFIPGSTDATGNRWIFRDARSAGLDGGAAVTFQTHWFTFGAPRGVLAPR